MGMAKPRSRAGGIYVVDDMGRKSDTAIHAEIMAGVSDYPQRLQSAKRLMAALGLSRQEAEAIFDIAIDKDVP